MKKFLLALLLISSLLLGACGGRNLEFTNPSIINYDIDSKSKYPQGVNNGTVNEDVYTSMMYVNRQHVLYLDLLSDYDLNDGNLGKIKAEKINEITDLMQETLLDVNFIEITKADEEISKVIYPYMVSLIKEADNTGRYVMYKDKTNLEQALEYREKNLKYAKELDELVEKYDLK